VRPPGGEAGQETSERGLHSFSITSVVELGLALTRLQRQVSSQEAFLTHVEVDGRLLGQRTDVPVRPSASRMTARGADRDVVAAVARLIADERIALWVGRGSQSATTEIQALLRRTGWPAIATPAAKGVVPEDYPAYIGVSSSIGHRSVPGALRAYAPSRLLVLGLETDEHDPFDTALVPRGGIVHVQPQPAVSSFPWNAPVLSVPADVGAFVEGLLRALPARGTETTLDARRPFPADPPSLPTPPCWVRPAVLMSRLQRMVLDCDDARILVDGRRATALAARHLRLLAPGRLRLLGRRAPAGQLVDGAIGAATAGGRVVCVTDDPFLLLSSQATVAAAKRLPVSWVVLNQGRSPDRRIEPVGLARAMGVEAVHVEREAFLDAALSRALTVDGPFVVEVVVNRRAGTSLSRNGHRVMQGWA
jgi:acetolactate synthase-1/2/3 large subunit